MRTRARPVEIAGPPKPLVARPDLYADLYLIGGEPWIERGELKRIYFRISPGLRGQSAWETKQERSFPSGYFDVARQEWVTAWAGWTQSDYAQLMKGVVRRGTCADYVPREHCYTSDGVQMTPGDVYIFIGGGDIGRPEWDMSKLVGRVVVARKRFGVIGAGKKRRYGSAGEPVMEHAVHEHPSAWTIVPASPDSPLLISAKGGGVETQWSYAVVDPAVSLVSITDVRGRNPRMGAPALPAPAMHVETAK